MTNKTFDLQTLSHLVNEASVQNISFSEEQLNGLHHYLLEDGILPLIFNATEMRDIMEYFRYIINTQRLEDIADLSAWFNSERKSIIDSLAFLKKENLDNVRRAHTQSPGDAERFHPEYRDNRCMVLKPLKTSRCYEKK